MAHTESIAWHLGGVVSGGLADSGEKLWARRHSRWTL